MTPMAFCAAFIKNDAACHAESRACWEDLMAEIKKVRAVLHGTSSQRCHMTQ